MQDRTAAPPSGPAGPALSPVRNTDHRVDIKELARILRRRRTAILVTAAGPIAAALAYLTLATPLYTASTQLLIDPRDRRILNNEINPENLAADGGVAVVESQLLVLTSDAVLRRAIRAENLDRDPEFGGEPTGVLAEVARHARAALGIKPGEAVDPELKALRQIKRRIGVKRSEKAFVIDIYLTTDTKEKSVRVADAVAQAYLDDQTEARAAVARRAAESLTGRLDELRRRVRDAENAVAKYREERNIVGAGGVLVDEQQLSEMNIQLNSARARTAEAASRLQQITQARKAGAESGAVPEAVQSQTVGQLRVQYAEVARQQADVGARLGPRHPTVATLDAQATGLRRQIAEELGRIAAAARSDLDRAQANEKAIRRDLDVLKRRAVQNEQAFVRLRELEREAEVSRTVYQSFLVRARELGEQQSIDSTNARVISRATPPRDNSWPPRGLLAAVGIVFGLGLGAGVGLMREYLDERIHSRAQLRDLTARPVLAALPRVSSRRRGRRWFRNWRRRKDQAPRLVVGVTGSAAGARNRAFARAIRVLWDALMEGERPPRGRRVLVSSSVPGEGRTTVALDLALAAAAEAQRVLLVDADLSRRTLSRMLGAAARSGLAEVLHEGASVLSSMLSDDKTGLNFLPAGDSKVLEGRRMKPELLAETLAEPMKSFDLVIIDSGAVLSDPFVRAFVQFTDDVVFLVRAGATRQPQLSEALEAISGNSHKLRGTVLTAATENAG